MDFDLTMEEKAQRDLGKIDNWATDHVGKNSEHLLKKLVSLAAVAAAVAVRWLCRHSASVSLLPGLALAPLTGDPPKLHFLWLLEILFVLFPGSCLGGTHPRGWLLPPLLLQEHHFCEW